MRFLRYVSEWRVVISSVLYTNAGVSSVLKVRLELGSFVHIVKQGIYMMGFTLAISWSPSSEGIQNPSSRPATRI